jgi:hypothetical protein
MRSTTARSPFFLYLSMAFLVIAIVGFSTTFFFPLARGTFSAPLVVHVHGALLFGWLVFFIAQATLINTRKLPVHRSIGWFGLFLSIAIVISGVAVGLFATHRDLAASGETWPIGEFVNIVIEMALFGSLVWAAILSRRRPESHKRYLVLATISALGPAWFRFRHFMPYVPHPLVTFSLVADSLLLLVIARDWIAMKRIHPVYLWAGGAMFAVHMVELSFADSELWLAVGRRLLGLAAP